MVKIMKKALWVCAVLIASIFCTANIYDSKTLNIQPSIKEEIDVGEASDPTVTIEADFTKGEVSGGGRYAVGDTVNIVATANEGCYFVKWQIKGAGGYEDLIDSNTGAIISDTNYSFVIGDNIELLAVFDFQPYTISSNFDDYFDLKEFSYEYDSTRFDADSIVNYPRADKDNAFSGGNVYYNDIVSMKFEHKEGVYVKELSATNFTTNTNLVAVINVSAEGKLLSTEINRVITNYESQDKTIEEAIVDNTITFDYDNYTYYILTQKKVGDKYTTIAIDLQYKVKNNANFSVNANRLYLFTISAEDSNGNPINISTNLTNLISFDYGYFGGLDISGETQKYLIEDRANYSFSFDSDKFYAYRSAELGKVYTDPNIRGYFNTSYLNLKVVFERIKYSVSFEEYVRIGTRVLPMTTPWYSIVTQNVYPGQTVELDIENKTLTIDTEVQLNAVSPREVYGYCLFAVGADKTLDSESLSPYSVKIDNSNPSDIIVYIIHKQLDYNLYVDVVDTKGYTNDYLKSKINYMTVDKTVHIGDEINLTGIASTGFEVVGWKELDSVLTDANRDILVKKSKLDTTKFTFMPTSNVNLNLYYYLVADYKKYNLDYKLDTSSFFNNNPMATISLVVIDYFTLDASNNFAVYGKEVAGTTISTTKEILSVTLAEPTQTDKGDNKIIYSYATPIGDIEVLKVNGENTTLTYASHTYDYLVDKFTKDMSVSVDYEITYTLEETSYFIQINKTCDDVVICFAQNNSVADYKFSYFTSDKKSTLASRTIDATNGKYAYIYYENKDMELISVFSLRTQDINVYIQGDGYELDDVNCTINNSTTNVQKITSEPVPYIRLSAENGNQISIKIYNNSVKSGYKYTEFITNYSEMHPSGVNAPQVRAISGDTLYYEMYFDMTSEYADLEVKICFDEINYTVEIKDNSGKGLLVKYTNDSSLVPTKIIDGKFTINWLDVATNPYLLMSSANGYYISNAYIKEDVADNSLNEFLKGEITSQTIDKKFAIDNFEKYILGYADETNTVTIYIDQTERTYSISIEFRLNGKDSAVNTKWAKITYAYNGDEKTKGPELILTNYTVVFDEIVYGTTGIKLTMDATAVTGIKFLSWCKIKEDTTLELITPSLEFNLTNPIVDNISYCALFECLEYSIEFKYVYQNGPIFKEYDTNINVGEIKEIKNQNFEVGDKVEFTVASKPGYSFVKSFYGYMLNFEEYNNTGKVKYVYTSSAGIKTVENNNINENSFEINATTNTPYNGFNEIKTFQEVYCTKAEQISDAVYRKLVIYLMFIEKTYSVATVVENLTDTNTTSKNVEDWIDSENYSIKYKIDKDSDYIVNEDTNPTYKTNSYIEIRFKNSFNGIVLEDVLIGNSLFRLTYDKDKREHEVAGQTMVFEKDTDVYILKFQLNTILLEDIADTLNISLRYNIKKYKIQFSGQCNNKVLDRFNLILTYNYGMGGTQSENKEDGSDWEDKYFVLRDIYYGTELSCGISLENITNDFNDLYYFAYFYLNGNKLQLHTAKENPQQAYAISFTTQFGDVGEEFTIWTMAENFSENVITIVATFAPKITLNGFEYNEQTNEYTKTSNYTSFEQPLIVGTDIIYDKDEFGDITVRYNGTGVYPKNAGSYNVTLVLSGFTFDGTITIVIKKALVMLMYNGGTVTKEYDGSIDLTDNNKKNLTSSFGLDGLQENDIGLTQFNFNSMTGEYLSKMVGENIDIKVYGIMLSDSLKQNYEFTSKIDNEKYYITNVSLIGKGKIDKRAVYMDSQLFAFENIVYKENENYKLKYTIDYNREIDGQKVFQDNKILVTNLIAGDEVYINYNNDISSIEFILENYSIGKNKKVTVSVSGALAGADSSNYQILDLEYKIDIYPYMLTYTIDNIGTFAIIDVNEQCLIPIDYSETDALMVEYIDSTNPDYPNMYNIIEGDISKDEKIHAFYNIHLTTKLGTEVPVSMLKGCYFSMPKIKDIKVIYQLDNNSTNKLDFIERDSQYLIKIGDDLKPTLCAIEDKNYFAIWKIILLVSIIVIIILIILFIIIIFKRKNQKESEKREKI